MNNKEIKLSILNDDTEALPNDVKVSDAEKERIFKMSQKMYDTKKKSADTNSESYHEESGVERYRRPKWYRTAGFVAAFVIAAAGIGGSTLMIMNMRNVPNDISTQLESESNETEPTESEEPEEPTEPEIVSDLNYDMSAKEGIYNKMLNSIDFYDKVSGKYVHGEYDDNRVEDFSVDLDTCDLYIKTSIVDINNLEDTLNGMLVDAELQDSGPYACNEYIQYCDGELFYRIDGNYKDPEYRENNQAYERDSIPFNEDEIAFMKEWFFERRNGNAISDDSNRLSRKSPLDEVTLGNIPFFRALCYLSDFDEWEITGEETFIGRDCVVLEGNITLFCEPDNFPTFTMYVDKETGFVLKFIDTEAGEIQQYCVYQEIFFDDDAEMVFLDLDQYETVEHPEPDDTTIPKVNSKGETYGVALVRSIQENYDKLPDLIGVGFKGYEDIVGYKESVYIRKDEFLGTFIDGGKAFDMQVVLGNVSDTAVAVNLNVYDHEGELLGTETLYSEPENLIIPDVNSNGETYGYASIGMYQENYDKLPDLIAVDIKGGDNGAWVEKGNKGYIFFRKDEFFNKLINGKDIFVEPSDTSDEVELNVYDQEGEFVGTLQFYSESDNIK